MKYSVVNHAYIDAYGKKLEILKSTPSPRIILLGGSNLAFGIDSKAIADTFGINVVNYGLSMGIGLRVMMLEAPEYCREGDILVISPEYEHFFGNAHGEKTTLCGLALLYPEITHNFDTQNFLLSVSGLKNVISLSTYSILGISSGDDTKEYKNSSLSFNDYGDETQHWYYPSEDIILKTNPIEGDFDESFYSEFITLISELESKGIKVVIVPPAIYDVIYYNHRNSIHLLDMKLAETNWPFSIDPEMMAFPREDMFDTYYHLTKGGVDKRTTLLINILKQQLAL